MTFQLGNKYGQKPCKDGLRKRYSLERKGINNPNWKGTLKKSKCMVCGKEFLRYKQLVNKYCSKKCLGKCPIYRKNLSNAHIGLRTGYKHSKETIEKIKKSNKGKHSKKGEGVGNWRGGISTYERKLWQNLQRRTQKIGNGGIHTQDEWETLKKKHNWTCLCCKRKPPKIVLTEDHIVPVSKGGSDNIENIQPLCRSCNSIKNNKIIKYET